VLVSQLCDYLKAGWQLDLKPRTTEHALQPFSRRYFEAGGLLTYAGEWRAAHAEMEEASLDTALPPFEIDDKFRLRLSALLQFLRQPVKYFFRQRLGVIFGDAAQLGEDEEPFTLQGLERYGVEDALLDDTGAPEDIDEVRTVLAARAQRLVREGVLPIGLIGRQMERQLVDTLEPVRRAWVTLCHQYPLPAPKLAIDLRFGDVLMEDWIDQLRTNGSETVWLMQLSSKVIGKKDAVRGDKLLAMWLRQLAAAAQGMPVLGILVARDAIVSMAPLDPAEARIALQDLAAIWRDGMNRPLPVACKTALALLQEGDPRATYDGVMQIEGESADLCLARLWPDFGSLASEPEWPDCAEALYGPLVVWLKQYITVDAIEAGLFDGADDAKELP
jgi:exodeoxyribonuclease V gamma subunit